MKRPLLLLLAAAIALSGCSLQTLGAPKGALSLTARFPDAQNLVAGHSVQISDIRVGSVTRVRLVGYEAEVTLSIDDRYKVPDGTAAEIALTSLLGENYVKLVLPAGGDLARGPFLADGARITRTSVAPQFEQVAGNAGRILQAISGEDVGTLVNEGAAALGGQGDRLNRLIAQSGDLVAVFAGQREALGDAVDELARLGRTLARSKNAFDPDGLEKATRTVDRNKEKILTAVEKLTETARLLNDRVFVGRTEKLRLLVKRIEPTIRTLGSSRDRLTDLIANLVNFEQVLPRVVWDGQLMVHTTLKPGIYSNDENPAALPDLPLLEDFLKGVK